MGEGRREHGAKMQEMEREEVFEMKFKDGRAPKLSSNSVMSK